MASPLPWGERGGVRGKWSYHYPHLNPPHQGGGKFFRELDALQLCCGVLHLVTLSLRFYNIQKDLNLLFYLFGSITSRIGMVGLNHQPGFSGQPGHFPFEI